MKAFQVVAAGTAELLTVADPEPHRGEVLVKVGAAGLCHSDLDLIDTPSLYGFRLPHTLGHEIAGWVEAVGAGVAGWRAGDAVAVYGITGCGCCRACDEGRDNDCGTKPPGGLGLSRDGGLAEYVRVPAKQLIAIGDLSVTQAAPLTDAGLTAYHAVRLTREACMPGATCIVIGTGGVGELVVSLLAATSTARIIAIDAREAARARALAAGAHYTLAFAADVGGELRQLLGRAPRGAEVVIDCVGSSETLLVASSFVAIAGWLVIVGLGGGTLPVTAAMRRTGLPRGTRVVSTFWGSRGELRDVMAMARTGRLNLRTELFSLDDTALAYARLRAGQIYGRGVVTPHADSPLPLDSQPQSLSIAATCGKDGQNHG